MLTEILYFEDNIKKISNYEIVLQNKDENNFANTSDLEEKANDNYNNANDNKKKIINLDKIVDKAYEKWKIIKGNVLNFQTQERLIRITIYLPNTTYISIEDSKSNQIIFKARNSNGDEYEKKFIIDGSIDPNDIRYSYQFGLVYIYFKGVMDFIETHKANKKITILNTIKSVWSNNRVTPTHNNSRVLKYIIAGKRTRKKHKKIIN